MGTAPAALQIRREELRRRIEALPNEADQWRADAQNILDMQAHHSQLEAIKLILTVLIDDQRMALAALDPGGEVKVFEADNYALVKKIIKAQKIWDFFREKLGLRLSKFKDELWTADTIAWNCYRPVLDKAVEFEIVQAEELREPPLVYLAAGFSPLTWRRGSRPNDGRTPFLEEIKLPIPVIEVPWEHLQNVWELVALHHEVGHDLEADLGLRQALLGSLQDTLAAAGVRQELISIWLSWEAETLADLIGLQLAGPAFTEALVHLLMLPRDLVTKFDDQDSHPNHYVRILMNAAYVRTLIPDYAPLLDHANQIEETWKALYGDQIDPSLEGILQNFGLVFKALMDTPLSVLKGKTVRELMVYSQADDLRIRATANFLRTGQNRPTGVPPRHAVSGARIALTQAAAEGALATNLFTDIQQRTMDLVRKNAPPGLRGGGGAVHKKFLVKRFTEAFSDAND